MALSALEATFTIEVHNVTMLQFCKVTRLQCYNVTMLQCDGSVGLRSHFPNRGSQCYTQGHYLTQEHKRSTMLHRDIMSHKHKSTRDQQLAGKEEFPNTNMGINCWLWKADADSEEEDSIRPYLGAVHILCQPWEVEEAEYGIRWRLLTVVNSSLYLKLSKDIFVKIQILEV